MLNTWSSVLGSHTTLFGEVYFRPALCWSCRWIAPQLAFTAPLLYPGTQPFIHKGTLHVLWDQLVLPNRDTREICFKSVLLIRSSAFTLVHLKTQQMPMLVARNLHRKHSTTVHNMRTFNIKIYCKTCFSNFFIMHIFHQERLKYFSRGLNQNYSNNRGINSKFYSGKGITPRSLFWSKNDG